MSRYIDADVLRADWLENGENEYVYDTNAFLDSIDNAPTADVAPVVHGRWLTWEEQFPGEMPKKKSRLGVFCSACHNYSDNMFDYCPNCGCRMDENEGESDGTKS